MGLTHGFGRMGDLLGPSKINSGLGKRQVPRLSTEDKFRLTHTDKAKLAVVVVHLWLIAAAIGLISRIVTLWEKRSSHRRGKMDKILNKEHTTIIDVTVIEEED